jgi:hypothetical protein
VSPFNETHPIRDEAPPAPASTPKSGPLSPSVTGLPTPQPREPIHLLDDGDGDANGSNGSSSNGSPPHHPPTATARPGRRWGRIFANIGIWTILMALLAGFSFWAFGAGMQMRRDMWDQSRTFRFNYDISNAYYWGNQVMATAEDQSRLPPMSDALADQPPGKFGKIPDKVNGTTVRRLSLFEVVEGIEKFFDDREKQGNVNGQYELDYPPLRLSIMTFWVRYVQRDHPTWHRWPNLGAGRGGRFRGQQLPNANTMFNRYNGDPGEFTQETAGVWPEDIAQPLLNFNTICAGATAIAMFFLVVVWSWRASRPAQPSRIARLWKWLWGTDKPLGATPIQRAAAPTSVVPHGMLLFLLATGGFWYAYVKLAGPPSRPMPIISQAHAVPKDTTALLTAAINPEQSVTIWRVEWGITPAYGHKTPIETIPAGPPNEGQETYAGMEDVKVQVTIDKLTPGQLIYYRFKASNAGGVSDAPVQTFIAGGAPNEIQADPVGGVAWPDWTVWSRMLVLFITMVYAARRLPIAHRGWGCGIIAAMLVWLNPAILVSGHVWPQWDVWVLPFFTIALLFASIDWWLTAGLFLGVGCMFKGQLLLGSPVLLLWPLFEGRFSRVIRGITGVAIGAGLVVSPWLIRPLPIRTQNYPALAWIEYVMLAALLVAIASRTRGIAIRAIKSLFISGPKLAEDIASIPLGGSVVTGYTVPAQPIAASIPASDPGSGLEESAGDPAHSSSADGSTAGRTDVFDDDLVPIAFTERPVSQSPPVPVIAYDPPEILKPRKPLRLGLWISLSISFLIGLACISYAMWLARTGWAHLSPDLDFQIYLFSHPHEFAQYLQGSTALMHLLHLVELACVWFVPWIIFRRYIHSWFFILLPIPVFCFIAILAAAWSQIQLPAGAAAFDVFPGIALEWISLVGCVCFLPWIIWRRLTYSWLFLFLPALFFGIRAIYVWKWARLHWPAHFLDNNVYRFALLMVVLIAPWFMRTRRLHYYFAIVFAGALWLSLPLFHGSDSWLTVGFEYGTVKHDTMAMGAGSFANFATILADRYHWDLHDVVGTLKVNLPLFDLHKVYELDFKQAMTFVYGIAIVLCAIAAAVHSRRNDPRLLVAMLAPWLIFPCIMSQMSERYTIWAAGLSASLIVLSTGLSLMSILLTLFSAGMIAHQTMMAPDRARWPAMFDLFTRLFPDAGWMMLMIALVFFALALMPSRKPGAIKPVGVG